MGDDVRRVLVADDDADTREILEHFLRRNLPAGYEVTAARDGREATRLFKRARKEGRPFCFVLLDQQMPVMGGSEAARQMRALDPELDYAFLTAFPDDVREEQAEGAVGVWLKPDDLLEVASRIHEAVEAACEE